jgi:hypothetical protein
LTPSLTNNPTPKARHYQLVALPRRARKAGKPAKLNSGAGTGSPDGSNQAIYAQSKGILWDQRRVGDSRNGALVRLDVYQVTVGQHTSRNLEPSTD